MGKISWSNIVHAAQSVKESMFREQDRLVMILHLWHRLVEHYSAKKLTCYSDVLPALSAVACQVESHGAGRYLAGLWTARFIEQLLWGTSTGFKNNGMRLRTSTYIAPSFSWASRIGPITYHKRSKNSTKQITILEMKCTPKYPANVHGEVSSGLIKLRGRLISANLHPLSCNCRILESWEHPSCHVVRDGHRPQDFDVDTLDDAT